MSNRKTYSNSGIDFNYLSKGKWAFRAQHKSENFTFICKVNGFEIANKVASQVSASLVRSLKKNDTLELDNLGRTCINKITS
jgi:hypothetical protein